MTYKLEKNGTSREMLTEHLALSWVFPKMFEKVLKRSSLEKRIGQYDIYLALFSVFLLDYKDQFGERMDAF